MKLSTVFLAIGVLATSAVCAQAPDQGSNPPPNRQAAGAAVRKACQDDMKSMCPDKQGRQMMMCLRSNHDKLSSGCQKAMAQLPPRAQSVPPAAPAAPAAPGQN
jgi:hypothetical protein